MKSPEKWSDRDWMMKMEIRIAKETLCLILEEEERRFEFGGLHPDERESDFNERSTHRLPRKALYQHQNPHIKYRYLDFSPIFFFLLFFKTSLKYLPMEVV